MKRCCGCGPVRPPVTESWRRRFGKPQASRAVGQAVGHNPICIVVPCHRVLGRDGSLHGFAFGLDKKAALLKLEGVSPYIGQLGTRGPRRFTLGRKESLVISCPRYHVLSRAWPRWPWGA
jgi:O-6-methylguanine DNA methyltransferase